MIIICPTIGKVQSLYNRFICSAQICRYTTFKNWKCSSSTKSDQCQIPPASSPEIQLVWRTWLFIVYSEDHTSTSHQYIVFVRLGEYTFWTWDWQGKHRHVFEWIVTKGYLIKPGKAIIFFLNSGWCPIIWSIIVGLLRNMGTEFRCFDIQGDSSCGNGNRRENKTTENCRHACVCEEKE